MRTSAAAVAVVMCLAVAGCGSDRAVVTGADRPAGVNGSPSGEPGSAVPTTPSTPAGTAGPEPITDPITDPATDPVAGSEAGAPGSGDWRVRRPASDGQIAAYTTHSSGVPGTRVGLKVSTAADGYRVWAYRIGAYDGGWGSLVWESGPQRGRVQPAPVFAPLETRTIVAPWRRDLTIDTRGWAPGYYALKLRTGSGWETLVPYVVSSESAVGTVALVAPITTWQAYNRWGGYSLYEGPDGDRRSWAVSFDRPYNGATGANDFRTAAFPIVVRAEKLGIPLSYFTNVDVHARPDVLAGANGYVSTGHDEYWTTTMRSRVTTARDAGTNLAFLGANTMYWRIRLADGSSGPDRTVVGYRDDAHVDPMLAEQPAEATARFRDAPDPQTEHDLIGMQYECYPVDVDYVVVSPGWWGFRGTGAGYGERIPGLVGPEADRVYPDRATPRPMQVLSHTSYPCRGVTTSAQSVYYTTPSGAGVFTAGTLRWGCALVDSCDRSLGQRTSTFVRVVTGNLLRAFSSGPVGIRHPARDNLADFHLPVVNTVSAS